MNFIGDGLGVKIGLDTLHRVYQGNSFLVCLALRMGDGIHATYRVENKSLVKLYIPQSELRRQEEEAKKMRLQGQNPDAGKDDGDLMSVAKDWAGELISGQTGTGRILVCKLQKRMSTFHNLFCNLQAGHT